MTNTFNKQRLIEKIKSVIELAPTQTLLELANQIFTDKIVQTGSDTFEQENSRDGKAEIQ